MKKPIRIAEAERGSPYLNMVFTASAILGSSSFEYSWVPWRFLYRTR